MPQAIRGRVGRDLRETVYFFGKKCYNTFIASAKEGQGMKLGLDDSF